MYNLIKVIGLLHVCCIFRALKATVMQNNSILMTSFRCGNCIQSSSRSIWEALMQLIPTQLQDAGGSHLVALSLNTAACFPNSVFHFLHISVTASSGPKISGVSHPKRAMAKRMYLQTLSPRSFVLVTCSNKSMLLVSHPSAILQQQTLRWSCCIVNE